MNDQEREELITQYVLGDLEGDQKRKVEEMLSASESCRALARDIESTLGLLRDAMAADAPQANRLDDLHAERVRKAAQQSASTPARYVRWLAQAAGVLILLGGISLVIIKPGYEEAPYDMAAKEEAAEADAPTYVAARQEGEPVDAVAGMAELSEAEAEVDTLIDVDAETVVMSSKEARDDKLADERMIADTISEEDELLDQVSRVEVALAAKTTERSSLPAVPSPLDPPDFEEEAALELAAASVTEREQRYRPGRSLMSKEEEVASDAAPKEVGAVTKSNAHSEESFAKLSGSGVMDENGDQALEGIDPTEASKRAVAWIKSQQQPNGSWGDDAHTTSLALLALLASGESADAVAQAVSYLNTQAGNEMSVPILDRDTMSQFALAQAARLSHGTDRSRGLGSLQKLPAKKKVAAQKQVLSGMKAISFRWDGDVRLEELLAYQQVEAMQGRRQRSWEKAIASRLALHQLPDGSWPQRAVDDGLDEVGTTALSVILLQVAESPLDLPIPISP